MKIGDSDLARWLQVEPMSTQRPGLTPYNYCQNNPLLRIDPTGMLDENWVTSTIAGVQGRMGMNNIIDGTTVTVNGDDNKKKEQKDKGTNNSSLVSPGLATLGISLDGIFRNLDDQFWLIVKELGYDRKSLTVIGGLGETAKIMGYSTFVLGVIVDYNRFQDGEISQSQLISNLSISLGILVSPVYGIPTYLWYQSLPQYFIQQQQALDAQEKMNYPVLPKFGF